MNVKLTESESVICELTAKVEETNYKESSINVNKKNSELSQILFCSLLIFYLKNEVARETISIG